jgi:DNA-binding LacI/PurR family transcriptional regulator
MSNLKDVARIAEVNISTVSRYLSGKLNLTPRVEQRIRRAIEQTGYQPNIIAQSLRNGINPTVAVIVPDIYQPGITGIISGIDDGLSTSDYSLAMTMTKGSAAREIEVLRNFRQLMVAGVIVIGHPFQERNPVKALREVIGEHIPMVFVSRNFRKSAVTEICPDQATGARLLTQHLIERGYRSIGIIVGRKDHPDAVVKLRGFDKALADAGLDSCAGCVEEGFYRIPETRAAVERLIQTSADAIFCTSDDMAVAAAQWLHEKGYALPRDMAVAGYGGTAWADIFSPRLTTVDVQVEQLGRTAVEHLLHIIEAPSEPAQLVTLPVSLKTGQTT